MVWQPLGMRLQSYFKASCFEEEVLIIPRDVTELQTPRVHSMNCSCSAPKGTVSW